MRYILIFAFCSLCFACNDSPSLEKEGEEETTVVTKKDKEEPEIQEKEQSWKEFWSEFQQAVVEGDHDQLKQLTNFGAITEKEIEENYEIFFGGESKAYFEKAAAADAKTDESTFEGLEEASGLMRFEIYESGEDEEGNEYESGISYYFGKINGSYKLVYIVAAG